MFSVTLQAQDEWLWTGPLDETLSKVCKNIDGSVQYPLYHQYQTYLAETPLIVNTHNTGTGKTRASHLRLAQRANRVGFGNLHPNRDNVLFIAPTNELLLQHADDIQQFCQVCDLPYRVLPITRKDLDDYRKKPGISEEELRRGAMLHMLMSDASLLRDDRDKRATVYVVNPDIFYYATTFSYSQFDRASLFRDFLERFHYFVIDELHYYTPKQLATFLFFIKLSQYYGYLGPKTQRQFCLLTATPRPQVKVYLERLGIPITWIEPGHIAPQDQPFVQPIRALTPVQLEVYSRDELQQGDQPGGLLTLATQQRERIRQWLDQQCDGAIISSSLGTVNTIHTMLKTTIKPHEEMGRITGAELRRHRQHAKKLPLILATPTVDIGYNFARDTDKKRQNIDFLLLDAFSHDELVQRIGRAGRVLGKPQQEQISTVLAVVDAPFYKELEQYAGQEMARSDLAHEAEMFMPKRNDLFAYIGSGAIIETFRPLAVIGQGTEQEDLPELEAFFDEVQDLFAPQRKHLPFKKAKGAFRDFENRHRHYKDLRAILPETFDWLAKLARNLSVEDAPPDIKYTLHLFRNRLQDAHKSKVQIGKNASEVVQWVREDVRLYTVERARFSFRESFEPPLALLYDEKHLHSSEEVATYSALHIMRYYRASYYTSLEEWQQACDLSIQSVPTEWKSVAVYCRLHEFLSVPLRVGLKLDAGGFTQDEWERLYAYKVTALHGLEVVARDDAHGLHANLVELLRSQFVPTLVARDDKRSRTASYLRHLQQQGRFSPLPLEIAFCDKTRSYLAIAGTMAFHVCAEIPYQLIRIDRHTTQREDESLFIC